MLQTNYASCVVGFCFQVLLNTPTKIYIPAEGKELPEGLPEPIVSLPPNLSVEQLQAALKTKKPTCAGISASYSCGNHDNVPQYSGTIVSVSAGDDIAMNSMVLSVVSIDGSGNGEGLIKVPMLNNIKLGVTLSGIKVAQGGCIVAGKAETSGIDVAVLNEKQRQVLKKAYAVYQQVLNVAAENAGVIAETYNDISDLYEGMAKKTQAMLDKLNNGDKISQRDAKALSEMKKQATIATDKMIEALKTKFGSEGSEEFIAFIKSTTESCVCNADIEKPKKGPNTEFYFSLDDDCKKCLEEQKKKQEQAAQKIKNVQKFLIVNMKCGCFSWRNIINDFGHDDENCEEVINKVEMVKNAIKTGKSLPTTDLTIQGQILIGSVCYTDLQIISIQGSLDPKKFEINSDGITFKNVLKFNISEPDNRKMKVELLRKYLFEEMKEVKEDSVKGEYASPGGSVDVSLLQTSELGKKMLRISEGCTSTAPKKDRRKGYLYVDSKGYCTFGIGHLIRKGDCTTGDELEWGEKTWNEALVDFENGKLKEFEDIVKRHVEVPVTQSEFDAMVSFAFNVGEGDGTSGKNAGFSGSSFIKKNLNKGIRNADLMYNFKDNPNRRKSEVELFKTGEYKHYPGGKDISTLKIACDEK
jgi:GH24 family phage-related lysozyme (muramidase)